MKNFSMTLATAGALTAAGIAATATTASAQTNVQLYGRLDTSIDLMNNGQSSRTAISSNSSRWGLRGTEELGGNLRALFNLEAGFSSDTGAGNGS
ncbi:MAG: porin, partial [Burkholderiaceae bacterium]